MNAHFKFATLIVATGLAGSASAATDLLVYEGFDYGPANPTRTGSANLHGQPDGTADGVDATGLTGTWQDQTTISSGQLFMASGSLAFGDLTTTGNHVRSDTNSNNDIHTRPVSVALNTGSELWFSILIDKLQNNFSAAEGGFVIGNQGLNNSRVLSDNGGSGLQGFGVAPTTAGNNLTAYAWNGASQSVADAALTVGLGGGNVHLLVGQISFDTGAGGTDEYTLYDYQLNAGSIVGGSLSQIASTIEVDVDQSTLDTLSLTRQVNTAYDEIRIGTTLDSVLGLESTPVIPTPSAALAGIVALGGLAVRRRRNG